MNARVKTDSTRRTITVEVEPGTVPDLDVTESWHRKPRVIRPDRVTMVLVDGALRSVNISGGLVLKSGGASDKVRENVQWYQPQELPTTAPDWVRELITSAPQGCILWSQPEAQVL